MNLAFVIFWVAIVEAWGWGGGQGLATLDGEVIPTASIRHDNDSSGLPNIYAVAIKELQDLESQPLCHRTAAMLLINDCQVLEGKNDATVLTDSGRMIRDFVDFYAASMAICDLERGSFVIPVECTKFREGSLAQVPVSQQHQLHVSTEEIDSCLAGLAKSDSAWGTWVSYRHKARHFCEAARADREKTQSIHLYQRITKLLETLANGVDAEMGKRMEELGKKVQEAGANIESLNPQIGDLHERLHQLQELVSDQLGRTAEDSASVLHRGLEDATDLQRILSVLLSSALEANAEVASSHDKALDTVKVKTEEGLEFALSALATVTSSSSALMGVVIQSLQAVTELETQQQTLVKGLAMAVNLTGILSARLDAHDEQLSEATAKAATVLGTLDEANTAATDIRGFMARNNGMTVLYIVCLVLSLVWGLAWVFFRLFPPTIRNLVLRILGQSPQMSKLFTGKPTVVLTRN